MKLVPNAVSRRVGRQILITQKHSPTLLFAAGTVGVIATAVLTARATLKLQDVLDEVDRELDDIAQSAINKEIVKADAERLLIRAQIRGYLRVGQLYSPAIVVGIGSISALAGSHRILTKRNAALTAAYATIEKAFDQYRARVVEEYGEEKDLEFKRSVRKETVLNEKDKEVEVPYVDADGISGYARLFDELNQNWVNNPDNNLFFLKAQQTYANSLLHSRGHVTLNDVYDSLGMERSKEGFIVGWALNASGDGYVDFGIYDPRNDKARTWVSRADGGYLLDFNVDGVIYDKI